jgi:hypothetical protein
MFLLAPAGAFTAPIDALHPELLADPGVRAMVRLTPEQEARARAAMQAAERSLAREEREGHGLRTVAMSREGMVASRARSGLAAIRLTGIQRRRLNAVRYRQFGPRILACGEGGLPAQVGLSRAQVNRVLAAQTREEGRAKQALQAYICRARPPMEMRKGGLEPKRTPEVVRLEERRDQALWRALERGLTAPQRERLHAILYPETPGTFLAPPGGAR